MAEIPAFSLRPAVKEDLEEILNIEEKAYPRPWTYDQFKEEFEKPYCSFLALTDDETDNIIAGYIVFWQIFDEVHILNVTVALDWRGLGFGKRLIRHAIDEGLRKDSKRVILEVRKSNDAAVTLYQKLGFYIDHIKKSFYSDGEDAYFMVLYLQQKSDF